MFFSHIEHHYDRISWAVVGESLVNALVEIAWILPFMFAAFICIGLLERGAGRGMVKLILAADKVGPLAGGFLGALPSCGFSAAASNLYSAGLLTTGTLLSVYISTSDEMLAILVGENQSPSLIFKILAIKALSGIFCGFLVDWTARLFYRIRERRRAQSELSEGEEEEILDDAMECSCSDPYCASKGNLFFSAFVRTLRVVFFIFIISALLNMAFSLVDKDSIGAFLNKMPIVGCFITALMGLIPNCAVSVALTELFLEGIISPAMMLCGLMTGAGSGLLILFGQNKNKAENFTVIGLLLLFSIGLGSLCGYLFF